MTQFWDIPNNLELQEWESLRATIDWFETFTPADESDLVHKSGDEIIDWIKTFSSSPIVPTPTTDFEVATKKYVDDNAWWGSSLSYSAINSSQAITNWNYYWVTCTGDIILTLADWTSIGQNLSIKKLDNTAYTITITGNIEWETSIIMDTQYESLDLFWNWNYYIIK